MAHSCLVTLPLPMTLVVDAPPMPRHDVDVIDAKPELAPAPNDSDKPSRKAQRRERRAIAKIRRHDARQAKRQARDDKQRAQKMARQAKRQQRRQAASDNASQNALAVVAIGLAVVVSCSFVVAFAGLLDFGTRVAHMHVMLAVAASLSVEGMTVCSIGATYALRHAPWRMRLFAWCVFVVPVGLSVSGNVAHAQSRHLSPAAQVAAGISPILLALGTHLLVVVARYHERVRAAKTTAPVATGDTSTPAVAAPKPEPRPTQRSQPKPATPAPKTTPVDDSDPRQVAHDMATKGKTASDIHDALASKGHTMSLRTVQRWISDTTEKRDDK